MKILKIDRMIADYVKDSVVKNLPASQEMCV